MALTTSQSEPTGALLAALRRSRPALKLIALGIMVLLLGIPIASIGFLSTDRQSLARQTSTEIARQWGGGSQILSGPYLIVPYRKTIKTERVERRKDCPAGATDCEVRVTDSKDERHYLSIAPDTLRGSTRLATEKRYRGIYETPVYTAQSTLSGQFRPANLTDLLQAEDTVLWDEAFLALLVSDRRTFQSAVDVKWNGSDFVGQPGPSSRREGRAEPFSGIHVPLPRIEPKQENNFSIQMTMLGGLSFGVLPNGREVDWKIEGDWPDPSFSGLFLPNERAISASGFSASWHLPQIARQQENIEKGPAFSRFYRASLAPNDDPTSYAAAGTANGEFSVRLFAPVDLYSRVDRSLKYALLFIGFVTLALYLIEIVNRDQAVHPVQYLFVGMANVIFHLLLLSLSEQVGFGLAYLVAAVATISLISGYCAVILREWRRAMIVTAILIAVYALLWILLSLEDYALVTGSIMIFAALAVTMYATRKVNWYNPAQEQT